MSPDEEFERTLLRSAHTDAPDAAGTERARLRLSAALAGVAVAGGVAATSPHAAGAWALSKASVKWMLVGAVAGSLLTYRAMDRRGPEPAPMVTLVAPVVAPRVSAAPSAIVAAPRPSVSASATTPSALPRPQAANTLSAEIAALDDARRLLDALAADDALAAIARYHELFPHAHLAPEADVIALEALAAKADHANVVLRADRFLARYPAAPQAARVRELRAAAAK